VKSSVALITGSSKRVGAQIARTLHARGVNVAVHYRSAATDAHTLVEEFNRIRANSAMAVEGDLLDTEALPALIEKTANHFGALHYLVNNASSFFATPMGGITSVQWDDLIGSNLKAPIFLSQAAAPYLKAARGAIVNIVDIHTERPLKDFVVYNAAKAGLAGLTRSLALDLAPEVRVNGVSPGAIVWPVGDAFYDATERARITEQIPLKRVGNPNDIAGAVTFLLLDAPYITGQILSVDGGREIVM
jgi:pteridine reductase